MGNTWAYRACCSQMKTSWKDYIFQKASQKSQQASKKSTSTNNKQKIVCELQLSMFTDGKFKSNFIKAIIGALFIHSQTDAFIPPKHLWPFSFLLFICICLLRSLVVPKALTAVTWWLAGQYEMKKKTIKRCYLHDSTAEGMYGRHSIFCISNRLL